jgi:hypothetical protein
MGKITGPFLFQPGNICKADRFDLEIFSCVLTIPGKSAVTDNSWALCGIETNNHINYCSIIQYCGPVSQKFAQAEIKTLDS